VSVCECMRVLGQGTDDQVKRKRTSLLKVLEKRGGEKGRREVLGYLKKKDQGLFSSTLYPGTDLCWMLRGVASLPWVPGRSLLLTLD